MEFCPSTNDHFKENAYMGHQKAQVMLSLNFISHLDNLLNFTHRQTTTQILNDFHITQLQTNNQMLKFKSWSNEVTLNVPLCKKNKNANQAC